MNIGEISNLPAILILAIAVLFGYGCSATGSASNRAPGTTSTTFSTPSGFQISPQSGQSTSTALLVGYVNTDNLPDLILLTGSGIFLFTNVNGSSWTRSELSATTGLNYPAGSAYDLDGDGDSDLILFKDSTGLETYRNDAGTFTKIAELARGEAPEMLAYAAARDTLNRGYILAANATGNHFVLRQVNFLLNQDTAANIGNSIPKESGVMALQGDFNSDGYVDEALVSKSSGSPIQILKNTSDSSMSEIHSFSRSYTGVVRGSFPADINADGKLDLLLGSASGVELYTGNGDFTFSADTQLSPSVISVSVSALAAADFTGDDLLDLYIGRSGSTGKFYGQTSSMVFDDQTSTALGTLSSNTLKIHAVDLNNDSELDIVELFSSGKIAIHLNDR